MGNNSTKQGEELKIESPNGEIALEEIYKERYGIFYTGLDMERKGELGQPANKIHLKKGKQMKERKSKKTEKTSPHEVRYGIFYDSLKDEAVIIDMQNNSSN